MFRLEYLLMDSILGTEFWVLNKWIENGLRIFIKFTEILVAN